MTYHVHSTGEILDFGSKVGEAIDEHAADPNAHHERLVWIYPYSIGSARLKGDVVEDVGWLMHANKDTSDRAAPQDTGDLETVYSGTNPTVSVLAKQVAFSIRLSNPTSAYRLTQYEVYTIAGNHYDLYTILDPLGAQEIRPLISFTASDTGWTPFNVTGSVVPVGTTYDIAAVVQQPDPVAVDTPLDYVYLIPNNEAIPGPGEIIHATKAAETLATHVVDDNGGDNTAFYGTLTVGDIVQFGTGIDWSIQSITDNGTWFAFGVAPALQASPAGLTTFTFKTVTPANITYLKDPNYYIAAGWPSIQSVEAIDVDYSSGTVSDNALGINVTMVEVVKSADWDVMQASDRAGGGLEATPAPGGSSGVYDLPVEITETQAVTTDNQWTTAITRDVVAGDWTQDVIQVNAIRTDGSGYYTAYFVGMVSFDGAPQVDANLVYELGQTLLGIRAQVIGATVEYQIRGRSSQDWSWKLRDYEIALAV